MAKKKKKRHHRNISTLSQHKKIGKSLYSSLSLIPKMTPSSWAGERLPEMMWAALLIAYFPREYTLSIFREVADYIFRLPDQEKFHEVTHTALSELPSERLEGFFQRVLSNQDRKEALSPILLLESLPAHDDWAKALGKPSSQPKWENLMTAVAKTLDHQSQESTDCRWLRLLCYVTGGKLKLPDEEGVKEIVSYPDYGDMKKVRPTIRAAEIAVTNIDQRSYDWPHHFWNQCLRDTPCFPLGTQLVGGDLIAGTSSERVRQVNMLLIDHSQRSVTTTAVDEKHDTVFGTALYTLGVVEELLRIGNSQTIIARTALRMIVECFITLAYLVKKNDQQLWQSFRVFGAGQAKLTFLKLIEMEEHPNYVDTNTLEQLANEDRWQEFLPINLGHWQNSNLRKMSEEVGIKDIYDQFYSWTSTFLHGHWGAIRDTVFDTCGNPLHRLHRIPRERPRTLADVIPDVCKIADKILELVSISYPIFPHRISINPNTEGK